MEKRKISAIIFGLVVSTLLACGVSENLETTLHEHTYVETVISEATCDVDGKKVSTCSDCGEVVETVIPASGEHVWDEGKVVVEPTCVKNGEKIFDCVSCDNTKNEDVPATGIHCWNEGTIVLEATCVADGKKEYTCSNCGEIKQESITATEIHNWNEGQVVLEPNCATEGEKEYVCVVCSNINIEKLPVTDEHSWDGGKVTIEASCVKEGEKEFSCKICKITKKEVLPMVKEHSWDKGKVTKAATATEKGIRTYTCKVCGSTKTKDIPATGPWYNAEKNAIEWADGKVRYMDKMTYGDEAADWYVEKECYVYKYPYEVEPIRKLTVGEKLSCVLCLYPDKNKEEWDWDTMYRKCDEGYIYVGNLSIFPPRPSGEELKKIMKEYKDENNLVALKKEGEKLVDAGLVIEGEQRLMLGLLLDESEIEPGHKYEAQFSFVSDEDGYVLFQTMEYGYRVYNKFYYYLDDPEYIEKVNQVDVPRIYWSHFDKEDFERVSRYNMAMGADYLLYDSDYYKTPTAEQSAQANAELKEMYGIFWNGEKWIDMKKDYWDGTRWIPAAERTDY